MGDPGMIALGMLVAAFSLGWTCYSATASATTVTNGSAAASEEAANAAVADDMSQPLNGGRGVTSNKLSREIEHKADTGSNDDNNSSDAKEDAMEFTTHFELH